MLQDALHLVNHCKHFTQLCKCLLLVVLVNFVHLFHRVRAEVDLLARIAYHQYAGVYDGVVSHNLFLLAQLVLILKFSQPPLLELSYFFGQQLPIAFKYGLFLDYLSLVVLYSIVGEVSAKLVERCGIDSYLFYICALVFEVYLLFPALDFHGSLDNLESCANVRDVLDELLYFLHLRTVLIEQFVNFGEVIGTLLVQHHILKILELYGLVFDFM